MTNHSTPKKPVRTRFAPSPTGFMHVGGVRTALFAWLVARQAGGQFILRLEDTDKVREVAGSGEHIMKSLRWLGIEWDEGPDKGGPYAPYLQSDRLATYKEWAEKLVADGKAYADPYTAAEVDGFRSAAKAAKKPFLYRDYRPENTLTWDGSQPLRLKSTPQAYQWHDEVLGDLSTGPEAVDDFILMKSDGYPTYNFAHIIDDYLMECTHVIRSQEFISSVPKYLNLYDALGFDWPIFATLPYVMGPDGKKKLGKRDGAKDILEYAREGYLPEAMLNFLATLGWNDGTEQEIFSNQELIKKFSLDRVQRGGARFDEQRLLWMNGMHIRNLSLEELSQNVAEYWPDTAHTASDEYKKQVLNLTQERLKFFGELPELTGFFFSEPTADSVKTLLLNPTDKQLKKADQASLMPMLQAVHDSLEQSDFSEADINSRLNDLLEQLQTKPGVLFALVRIALTGSTFSPNIFAMMAVLGKTTSLGRLERALQNV